MRQVPFIISAVFFFLAGCTGAPITATSPEGRASTTYSMDMKILGACKVRTYRDGGMDSNGKPYQRIGKVFYDPEKKGLGYMPNFSWFSGAMAFASKGMINAMGEAERIAVLVHKNGEWNALEQIAPEQFRFLLADPSLEDARDKAAVILQTSNTQFANCDRVIWR